MYRLFVCISQLVTLEVVNSGSAFHMGSNVYCSYVYLSVSVSLYMTECVCTYVCYSACV